MAYPAVQGSPTTGYGSGRGEFTITLPSSIAAGERLVVIFSTAAGTLMQSHAVDSAYSGKRWLKSATQTADSTGAYYSTIFTKVAEGSGNDVLRVFVGHDAQHYGYIAYRISAANCVEYASAEDAVHDTDTNPPSLAITVSQARETLWIAATCGDEYATGAPSGYGSLTTVSGSNARVSAATKTSTATSEDPGVFTVSGTNDASGVWTIGIYNETESQTAAVNQVSAEVLVAPATSENTALVGGVYVEILSSSTPPAPPPEYFWQWNAFFHDFAVTKGSKYTANFTSPTTDMVPPDPADCVVVTDCKQPIVQCSFTPVTFSTNNESHYAFPIQPDAQTYLIQSVNTIANIGGLDASDVEHGRIVTFTLLTGVSPVMFLHSHGSADVADRLYLGHDLKLRAGDSISLQYINMTLPSGTTIKGWFLKAASEVSPPYDVGSTVGGKPPASAVLIRYPFPRKVVFPAGLTDSRGVCGTTATAQADFDIRKNGGSVGTMRFGIGSSTATFIMGSETTFAAGDILTVVAPGSQDATLADIGFGLAGLRY